LGVGHEWEFRHAWAPNARAAARGSGFALLAVVYGASGIMTFIVNQDRVVWRRDLRKDTTQALAAIKQFNPDDSWTPLAPEG
jgi:hypothetical protein